MNCTAQTAEEGVSCVAQESLSKKTEETIAQNSPSQDDPFIWATLMPPSLSPQLQVHKRGWFFRQWLREGYKLQGWSCSRGGSSCWPRGSLVAKPVTASPGQVSLSHLSQGSAQAHPTDKDRNNSYWTTSDVLYISLKTTG